MVLWIGLDDTDSLRGMCTTFLATEVVRELTPRYDLIGYPRLVRLNPNIPWKTRGNGALALRFGRGSGPARAIGRIGEREVLAYPRSRGDPELQEVRAVLERLMSRWAEFQDPTTNPAYAVLRSRPPASLYWRAVREVVPRKDARAAGRGRGLLRGYKNGRGIIGALAAVAWTPRDRTFEILAYRARSRWGTRREIDPDSVVAMDRAFPSTFNNYDYVNGRVVIAPHSPCPILFGIRGDAPGDLPAALAAIRGERPERWLTFETNQGTDDHIVWDDWSFAPNGSTSVGGTVVDRPRTRSGGHVLVDLEGRRRFTAVAYEPSKQFRDVVRSLRPGDRVRVWGSVRDEPPGLNLEKIRIDGLAEELRKAHNPRCPECGKSMKSMGGGTGFRCARGHGRLPPDAATFARVPRRLSPGWYEPPASARRHLAKPLQRFLPEELRVSLPPDLPSARPRPRRALAAARG